MEAFGIIQARDDSGSEQNGSSRDSEKWFVSGSNFKVELVRYFNKLNAGSDTYRVVTGYLPRYVFEQFEECSFF